MTFRDDIFQAHSIFLYYWLKNNWLWQYRLQCWLNTMFATHHYRPALSFSSDLRHELTYSLLWYADTTQIKCYHSVVLLLVVGSDWWQGSHSNDVQILFFWPDSFARGWTPFHFCKVMDYFCRFFLPVATLALLCSALLCVLGNGRWEKFYVCPKMLEKKETPLRIVIVIMVLTCGRSPYTSSICSCCLLPTWPHSA